MVSLDGRPLSGSHEVSGSIPLTSTKSHQGDSHRANHPFFVWPIPAPALAFGLRRPPTIFRAPVCVSSAGAAGHSRGRGARRELLHVIRSGNVATFWGADSPPEDVQWRQRPSFGRGSESMECRRPDVGGAKTHILNSAPRFAGAPPWILTSARDHRDSIEVVGQVIVPNTLRLTANSLSRRHEQANAGSECLVCLE